MNLLKQLWTNPKLRPYLIALFSFIAGLVLTMLVYPSVSSKEEVEKTLRQEIEQEVKTEFKTREEQLLETHKNQIKEFTLNLDKSFMEIEELNKTIVKITNDNQKLKSSRKIETRTVKDPSGREETVVVDTQNSESSSNSSSKTVTELTQRHEKKLKELESRHEKEKNEEKTRFEKQVSELKQQLASSNSKVESLEKTSKQVDKNKKYFGVGAGYTTDKMYSLEVSYQFWGPVYLQLSGDSDIDKDYRGRASLGIRF